MHPTFGSRSLQDANYYTTEVTFRAAAPKDVNLVKITRRPGAKMTANEHREKRIGLKGWIKGSSAGDLQTKIDDLQQDLHAEEQTFVIETGRTYTATMSNLVIPDIHYNQTIVPFEAEFVCADPFAIGDSQTASWIVPSGVAEFERTITISGTVYAVPTITYAAPGTAGDTTTSGLVIRNVTRGEQVTWSGGVSDTSLDYGGEVSFNYDTKQVQLDSVDKDHTGKFSRFEPGSNRLIVSYSGLATGGSMEFTYTPRYY